jgi:hypothetical protein
MNPGVRIGVSGHQSRPGIDWDWTGARIRDIFKQRQPVARAFTSLAVGSDQLFAREALAMKIPVTAIIPMPDYERCFGPDDLPIYRELLGQCDRLLLSASASDQESFAAAGRYVADSCDLLVAVWDGRAATGLGGTADIVRYCFEHERSVIQIDPILRFIHQFPSEEN